MDLHIVYKAGAFICNTLKRALSYDTGEYLTTKRIALDYKSTLLDTFIKLFGKNFYYA